MWCDRAQVSFPPALFPYDISILEHWSLPVWDSGKGNLPKVKRFRTFVGMTMPLVLLQK